jgi:hypothetical protein
MPPRSRPARSVLPVLAACLTLGIAGCGSDDIAFNGGIFDAVGLSDAGKAKTGDPRMAERAPLVVPPSLDRLPAPGEAAPSSQIADIKDPDEEKKLSQAEMQAKQDEFCKKNYEDPMARGDESVTSVTGPLGPCRKSILTAVKKWNEEDVPEGQ